MLKYKKTIIVILAVVLLLLVSLNGYYFFIRRDVGPLYYINKITRDPTDNVLFNNHYRDLREEYSFFNTKYKHKNVTVFIGDSITKRFNLYEFSNKFNLLNRGIYSDTTYGLIDRVEENVNNIDIDKLFLMIGYNDLAFRDNAQILGNIEKIVLSVHAQEIYLQSILPVNSTRESDNERILIINNNLKKIAINTGCKYIDIHSHFVNNSGGIKTELTRDGVHPNYMGYELWYSLVKTLL